MKNFVSSIVVSAIVALLVVFVGFGAFNGTTSKFATSTTSFIAQATTTDNGVGAVQVADGEYIVFQVQERYGCVADGTCTTATSTDRGISLDWFLKGHYKP